MHVMHVALQNKSESCPWDKYWNTGSNFIFHN